MSTRRFRMFAVLGCAGWLVALFYGCSSTDHPICAPGAACGLPHRAKCTANTECQSRFCVYGECLDWDELIPDGEDGCRGDALCKSGFCNDGRCAVLRADLVPHGKGCSADAQCQSGFCDRGTCGRRVSWRNYGTRCVLARPGTPVREVPDEAWCEGYLCMDGRCRSCQSDSECTRWQPEPGVAPSSEPLTCTKFLDWPGKQCGKVIPGQVCPDGKLPVPQAWSNEGPHPARAPTIDVLPDGAPLSPLPRKPEFDCQTWPDM
jgi:hypothetical protein